VGNSLVATTSLNFEAASTHSITVTTTDQSGASYSKSFLIAVNDVNEAPTAMTLSKSNIDENLAAGTEIAVLSTVDQDLNESFTYTVGGTDAQYFAVTGNRLLSAATFDFEDRQSYNIALKTEDHLGAIYILNVQININDINENPTNINLSNSTIGESAAVGSVVGAFTSTDPDSANTFTYSLGGPDSSAFAIAGSNIVTSQSLDHETKSLYQFDVISTDQGGLQFTKTFSVTVENSNEPPTDLMLSNVHIQENLPFQAASSPTPFPEAIQRSSLSMEILS
jgi:hypothetical protein